MDSKVVMTMFSAIRVCHCSRKVVAVAGASRNPGWSIESRLQDEAPVGRRGRLWRVSGVLSPGLAICCAAVESWGLPTWEMWLLVWTDALVEGGTDASPCPDDERWWFLDAAVSSRFRSCG